ncbi:hypothetical protein METBIDRAFT_9143 [Metschnikowia bicuspidata var. bicuspidata NRRL YB-4993]|uniref:U1-type domain-containing protein n=1 Tax=Metschnikowia bicuspidata var. bicuspidata NRRL YB-4993 TaxID=869754 RepID=A0A1A0HFM2_9ASCO|nr:hypothetical protein METBIDRAFT_9143 [Metschnikowia bicuspidata var. bicuspidata NRRL YB-4993]OBA22785.1 hypothetical protein METBIDRAFT_9143 [Metschnikowia bicuspidata var. bicuspidata NRRL YB-4993]
MDYSDRVNSKKGAGALADKHESNVHTKRRIKELLTTQVLDLDRDPYVFRNHLGVLECRLCLTTHTNEASYISHLGGKKHGLNLERRRILDEKYNKAPGQNTGVSMTNVEKRHWKPIGRPSVKVTKIRLPKLLRMGMLVQAQFPQISVKEPFFRFMSYFEMSQKNQGASKDFLSKEKTDYEEDEDVDPSKWQYLVLSAEPYENVAISFPGAKQVDTPPGDEMSQNYWWHWDPDSREFFLQVLFKDEKLDSR